MKKIKKMLRFCSISAVVLICWVYLCQIAFKFLWNFEILDQSSYKAVALYWEKGGVFNTFHDISLGGSLILAPVLWLVLSYKLYKYGFWKFVFSLVIKLYNHFNRPKNLEVEHVSIKNIGGKDKTIDEIISEKIEAQGKKTTSVHAAKSIREQIATKIEENENQ